MDLDRRTLLAAAALAAGAGAVGAGARTAPAKEMPMYGRIGKLTAQPGQGEALARLLVEDIGPMPGCLSYVVAHEAAEADVLWITEAWETKDAHAASLSLPAVRAAITKARPLIAGMETVAETQVVGGVGV